MYNQKIIVCKIYASIWDQNWQVTNGWTWVGFQGYTFNGSKILNDRISYYENSSALCNKIQKKIAKSNLKALFAVFSIRS